jgi:hypothetical protein
MGKGELEVKRLLLVFIIIATWMVVSCETSTKSCFGHWVKGPGHHRGTRTLLKDAHLPYYQCVDENNKGSNLKERRYL